MKPKDHDHSNDRVKFNMPVWMLTRLQESIDKLTRAVSEKFPDPPPTPQEFDCECVVYATQFGLQEREAHNWLSPHVHNGVLMGVFARKDCPHCHGTGRKWTKERINQYLSGLASDLRGLAYAEKMKERPPQRTVHLHGFKDEAEARKWFEYRKGYSESWYFEKGKEPVCTFDALGQQGEGSSPILALTALRDKLEPGWRFIGKQNPTTFASQPFSDLDAAMAWLMKQPGRNAGPCVRSDGVVRGCEASFGYGQPSNARYGYGDDLLTAINQLRGQLK